MSFSFTCLCYWKFYIWILFYNAAIISHYELEHVNILVQLLTLLKTKGNFMDLSTFREHVESRILFDHIKDEDLRTFMHKTAKQIPLKNPWETFIQAHDQYVEI